MGLSFIVGAIIPIVPYMIWSGVTPLYVSALLGGITLFGVGVFKGYPRRPVVICVRGKFFVIAVSAAGLGYLAGLVVQHFFPGVSIPA